MENVIPIEKTGGVGDFRCWRIPEPLKYRPTINAANKHLAQPGGSDSCTIGSMNTMSRSGTPVSNASLSRREVLRVGGLVGCGLTLDGLLRFKASAVGHTTGSFGRAKQVIMLYLHGGHPQQETFDPKPDGPTDLRGEFGAISTSMPGVQFSELLPRCARIADKMAVVRSMSHDNSNHVQASLPANTGHRHPPNTARGDFPPSQTDFPPIGAVVSAVGSNDAALPAWVRVGPLMQRSNGTVLHGQLPGFMGKKHASFNVDQSLVGEEVRIRAIQTTEGLTSARLTERMQLRNQFDKFRSIVDVVGETEAFDASYAQALNLLSSEKTRRAFDLASEPHQVRERYGLTEFGQRCLLARRLAEAGVPMTNVSYCHTPSGSWDTHSQNFKKMKESLGPTLDAALSALIADLDERGRLDDTLVIVNAEFGRTPKINGNAGRDHWPNVYSLALAGAGIRAGTVHGASDNAAAFPEEWPHDPKDFAATIYHLLGVPPDTTVYDMSGRPHRLVIGSPIHEILA